MSERSATPRKLSDIKYLTIHHSAVTPGANNMAKLKERAGIYDRGHKNIAIQYSWPSKTDGKYGYYWISYHYLVSKGADVLHVQNIHYPRLHASDSARGSESQNRWGIAVCVDGNYSSEHISPAQITAIAKLIVSLEGVIGHRFTKISGHRDTSLSGTSCPGNILYSAIPQIIREADKIRSQTKAMEEENKKLKAQVATLTSQLNTLKQENDKVKAENAQLKKDLEKAQQEIRDLSRSGDSDKIKTLERELKIANDEISFLKREIKELKKGSSSRNSGSGGGIGEWFKKFLTTDV